MVSEQRAAVEQEGDAGSVEPRAPQQAATHVGPTIKRLRTERGLSLASLAKASGVSVGMLSQIERDISNPSLRVLTQIRSALDVPPSALFEATSAPSPSEPIFVRRQADHPFLDLGYCRKELLTAGTQNNLQVMILHVPPGGSSGTQPVAYPAEKSGYILDGELVLRVGERDALLKAGDSFIFDGAIPHSFTNPSTQAGARLLWVIGKFPTEPQI
jgi:transcriptional regulator with XRE-family HTH domain